MCLCVECPWCLVIVCSRQDEPLVGVVDVSATWGGGTLAIFIEEFRRGILV